MQTISLPDNRDQSESDEITIDTKPLDFHSPCKSLMLDQDHKNRHIRSTTENMLGAARDLLLLSSKSTNINY